MGTAAVLTAAAVAGGTALAGTAAATAPRGTGTPGPAELRSALLTPSDTGMNGAQSTGGGSGVAGDGVSGCPALVKVLKAPPGPGTQEADFTGGRSGPLLSEQLTAGSSASGAAAYARDKAALTTCRDLTLTSDGTELALKLTPIRFGDGRTAATRMDGELSGVPVNGYLAFGRVGPVLVGYMFFQVSDTSSRLASALYRKAVDKVRHTVSTGGGTPV
ncbi:hypothetical protein RVR_6147 [Actinacidiphila reveromycinica]|uniref:Serine/threonine protein kinase n=2 Tax=Actinacidiphila reveromycinica TaxID=659352 RepID=A0A7U3VQ82_9ACTN|nr:hypothetical protein RVR_6147 [Streptomyces sp. SN-593]